MSRTVIKVCGITQDRDAIEAAHLGVDALGFHFDPASPRHVEPDEARRIADRLPVFVARVGVFRDEPLIRVLEIARRAGLTAVQLEGRVAEGTQAALAPVPWIKGLSVNPDFEPDEMTAYDCGTFLLRWPRPGDPETTFGWRHARTWSVYGRILLSGGLEPFNVGIAIEQAHPYGVDVGDGVEFLPGHMDVDRIEAFVEAVRRADARVRGD